MLLYLRKPQIYNLVLALILSRTMKNFLLVLFLFSAGVTVGQPQLQEQKIADNISMLVPNELRLSSPTIQRTTSPALAIYLSSDGQTELTLNISQLRWTEADMELLSQFYKANILNLYDQVDLVQEGIESINDRDFIVFEFSGAIVDEANAFSGSSQRSDYTYILYTIVPEGVLIFRFTCPIGRMNYWKNAVSEMMKSITFSSGRRR